MIVFLVVIVLVGIPSTLIMRESREAQLELDSLWCLHDAGVLSKYEWKYDAPFPKDVSFPLPNGKELRLGFSHAFTHVTFLKLKNLAKFNSKLISYLKNFRQLKELCIEFKGDEVDLATDIIEFYPQLNRVYLDGVRTNTTADRPVMALSAVSRISGHLMLDMDNIDIQLNPGFNEFSPKFLSTIISCDFLGEHLTIHTEIYIVFTDCHFPRELVLTGDIKSLYSLHGCHGNNLTVVGQINKLRVWESQFSNLELNFCPLKLRSAKFFKHEYMKQDELTFSAH